MTSKKNKWAGYARRGTPWRAHRAMPSQSVIALLQTIKNQRDRFDITECDVICVQGRNLRP